MSCQSFRDDHVCQVSNSGHRMQWVMGRVAEYFFKPSNLTACNFAALSPTGPYNTFLKRYTKYPLLTDFLFKSKKAFQRQSTPTLTVHTAVAPSYQTVT